jgi:hypothetical protein
MWIGVLLGTAAFVLFCLWCLGFLLWAIREHSIANHYRKLAKELAEHTKANPQPEQGGWTVTYKEGKAIKSMKVEGNDEGEVLANFLKQHKARYDSIVSIVR